MKTRRLQPAREHPYRTAGRWIQNHEGMIIAAATILILIFVTWLVVVTAAAASILGVGSYV